MGFSRGINYRGSQGLKRVATKHKDHAHRLRAKKAHLTSGFAKHLDSLRSSSRKLLKKLKGQKIEPEEPLEPSFDEKLDILFTRYDADHSGEIDAEELVKLLWDLTPPRERPFVKPNLGDANFIMEQCNDNGNVAYLSRDELKDAVLLWRRIEKSTRPSPTDRSRTGRQLGACCLKLCCGYLQGGES